ncbi:hypothetical protein M0R45_008647 [Rubus argutus]|uniref:Ycf15 n=1 Tax=Rubus argutus TaxID=59490 RepID=A0AAW1Y5N4_RUBAR
MRKKRLLDSKSSSWGKHLLHLQSHILIMHYRLLWDQAMGNITGLPLSYLVMSKDQESSMFCWNDNNFLR